MRNSRFAFMDGNWDTRGAYASPETQLSGIKPQFDRSPFAPRKRAREGAIQTTLDPGDRQ